MPYVLFAAAAIGSSVYSQVSSQAQATQAKKAAGAQVAEANAAKQRLQESEALAASQASEAIKRRQASMARSQSIYTSPLGVQDQAATARKTLLGV